MLWVQSRRRAAVCLLPAERRGELMVTCCSATPRPAQAQESRLRIQAEERRVVEEERQLQIDNAARERDMRDEL